MNKKLEKGITLIALIITIIVLLILAGVSIATLTGENGLLNKAATAKDTTTKAEAEEQVKLAIMASYNSSGKIDLKELKENLNNIEGVTNITEEITDESFPLNVTIKGQEVQINKSGNTITVVATEGTTIPEEPQAPRTYSVGDEVTVGGESFYVLEAVDENSETVTLLSKYNLNTAGTQQSNTTTGTACVFSSTNYWSSIEGITYPYDLNNTATSADTDAINKAKKYATDKGAISGRLLTYNEASALQSAISSDTTGKIEKMLWGKDSVGGSLCYWLSDAFSSDSVWIVFSIIENLNGDLYEGSAVGSGVRPVITISKSLIS